MPAMARVLTVDRQFTQLGTSRPNALRGRSFIVPQMLHRNRTTSSGLESEDVKDWSPKTVGNRARALFPVSRICGEFVQCSAGSRRLLVRRSMAHEQSL